MNKNIIILAIIFVIPLFAYFMLSKSNSANVSVANVNRPHVIKFTSNMCGACKQMEPVITQVMKNYQDSVQYTVIPVQVDNIYNRDMINKYHVNLVPTIIILDKNQKLVKRIEGCVSASTLDGYIKEAVK